MSRKVMELVTEPSRAASSLFESFYLYTLLGDLSSGHGAFQEFSEDRSTNEFVA
jgi:hypothetical protein